MGLYFLADGFEKRIAPPRIIVSVALLLVVFSYAAIAWFEAHLEAKYDDPIARARQRAESEFSTAVAGILPRVQAGGEEATEQTYFTQLVKINVGNLAAYYEMVKVQTDKSFRAALMIAYFGAALIAGGLGYGFWHGADGGHLTYVSTGAGVITEFVAGVFFWLYSKTVHQLRGYHDSLISVQNVLLAFKLVSDTKSEEAKERLVLQMCSYLMAPQPRPPFENQPSPNKGPL